MRDRINKSGIAKPQATPDAGRAHGLACGLAISICAVVVLLSQKVYAENAPATAPSTAPATRPGPKIWNLTSFLNGTSNDIAKSLNAPVNELAARLAEKDQPPTDLERSAAEAEARVLASVHRSPEYLKLKADYDAARREVDELRSANTPAAQRMGASSRMNRALNAMQSLERRQLSIDPIVIRASSDLRERRAERDRAVKSLTASLQKQLAWRNQLVSAMRTTFQMQGPLKLEREGLLGEFIPVRILGPREVLAEYRVPEYVRAGGRVADGINEFSAQIHQYLVLIRGVDTSQMKKGTPVSIDRHFRVTGFADRPPEWGLEMPLMLFRLDPVTESDLNELFDKINDFREPTLPASHARGQ